MSPVHRARRTLFALYALALVTATHWPGLAIDSHGFSRLDLVIHATAFAGWAILFTACGFFGPAPSRRNIARSIALALAYALLDELSQGIPILRRTVDPLDLAANGTGIVLVAFAMALWARGRRRKEPPTTYN